MSADELQRAFGGSSLRAAALQALATVDERPVSVKPIQTGNRKTTAVARFESHAPVVVQACAEQVWLRSEAALLWAVRELTTVPVPSVLAAGTHEGVAYMLTPLVTGTDLHEAFAGLDPERQAALAREFGWYLAQLHDAFTFDGFGALDDDLDPETDAWAGWFEGYVGDALDRLPPAFDPVRPALREVVADHPPAATSRLFPWDFRPGNALLADEGIAAILDWEAPLAAPPSLSVAKAEYLVADWYVDEPGPLREAFRQGYTAHRPYPTVPAAHRVAAIADSAVDSRGVVTNVGYPERDREASIAFHRQALERVLYSDAQ